MIIKCCDCKNSSELDYLGYDDYETELEVYALRGYELTVSGDCLILTCRDCGNQLCLRV